MIRSLIKLVLALAVGILVYNFFFGTPEEKDQSKAVFNKAGELMGSVWGLLRSEKEKFDEGKYDEALAQIDQLINTVSDKANELGEDYPERLAELKERKRQLEAQLDTYEEVKEQAGEVFTPKGGETQRTRPDEYDEPAPAVKEKQEQLNEGLEGLFRDMKGLVDEMEQDAEAKSGN